VDIQLRTVGPQFVEEQHFQPVLCIVRTDRPHGLGGDDCIHAEPEARGQAACDARRGC
jgi:hypothetical protein